MGYYSARLYLRRDCKKWAIVRLYDTKKEMQSALKKFKPGIKNHLRTLGCHCAYDLYKIAKGRTRTLGETGTIFLNQKHCGAGIATHEILHAVLWAHNHKRGKQQYPITINSMKEEEDLLHDFTFAVRNFYNWFWKVDKKRKKK